MTFPALTALALEESIVAVEMAAESDALDALIQDGMEASLIGLNDRTLAADLTALAIAANSVFAMAVAVMVAL